MPLTLCHDGNLSRNGFGFTTLGSAMTLSRRKRPLVISKPMRNLTENPEDTPETKART